MIFLSRTRPRQ